MRLTSFWIKKYRSIEDSGEIQVDENITTFVGINESGKTNLMRALKKINHVDDNRFNDLRENPIWHYNKFDPEEIFVTAIFKLDDCEKQEIKKISHEQVDMHEIKISKKKSMKRVWHLDTDQNNMSLDMFYEQHLHLIEGILNSIDPKSFSNGQQQKDEIIALFKSIGQKYKDEPSIRHPDILDKIKIDIEHFKTSLLEIQNDEINSIIGNINYEIIKDYTKEIKEYLSNRLPRFVYFENTGIIDSRIHLSSFVQKIDSDNLDDDEKTAKTLLDLGNLDPHKLIELGKATDDLNETRDNKDRLDLLLSLASKKISDEINSVWAQNEHNIEFSINGDDLRVWIINKDDNTKLQLEERSRGYQWYFSFYTIFNVESERRLKDTIILLDEPALFLHAVGQENFLKNILPKLAEKNQILYTTHSPFMVDMTKPDSIHTVTLKNQQLENKTTQKVSHISNKSWSNDKDALFPLQSALHYTMAQSMFIGRKNLIVEGVTDFWLLSSASSLLGSAGKTQLNDDFVLVPAGGATKSILFASMYKSQNLEVAVLLDADKEGDRSYDLIVKNKILRDKKIIRINEVFDVTKNMSIEDIFPEPYYLKFVESAYQKELSDKGIVDISLNSNEPMIVKRLENFFDKNKLGKFSKNKPNREILKEFGEIKIDDLPDELVKKFEKVFEAINKML